MRACRFFAGQSTRTEEAVDDAGLEGTFVELASSASLACARTSTGRVYCWGSNFAGKLGLGGIAIWQPPTEDGDWHVTTATPGIPFPTRPVGTATFVAVSASGHGSAALSDEAHDNAYAWGRVASIVGLLEDGEAFARATRSLPMRLDLSDVPGRRFVGVQATNVGGYGWTRGNDIYRWGETEPGHVRKVAAFDRNDPIQRIDPLAGKLCVVTARGRFCEREPGVFVNVPAPPVQSSQR